MLNSRSDRRIRNLPPVLALGLAMLIARKRRSKGNWDGNIYGLRTIGRGVSGVVLEIDRKRVVKVSGASAQSIQDIQTEGEVYRILSKPPVSENVVRCLAHNHPRGIVLENLEETVRRRLLRGDARTPQFALDLCLGAARGLAFIHSRGIIQGDVGCHNMLLDSKGTLKLCDFSGSSIHGKETSVSYETRSRSPSCFDDSHPNEETDIFALGSAMYEICLGHAPYPDLSDDEITHLYRLSQFPSHPRKISPDLWRIIESCWRGLYPGASKVVKEIEKISISMEDNVQRNVPHYTKLDCGLRRHKYRQSRPTISETLQRTKGKENNVSKGKPFVARAWNSISIRSFC